MGIYRRSRVHRNNREVHRAARTRARVKDLDQVHEDLRPENLGKLQTAMAQFDPDLPGGGQFPCVPCRYLLYLRSPYSYSFYSRHFADKNSIDKHLVSKLHKKRMKVLKEKPYTLEEARAAGGEGTSAFYAAASATAMAL